MSQDEKFNKLYIKAMEERPEQFIPASMPYVKCKINGIELLALIDSGSMITCTNLNLAERCGFLDEVDTSVVRTETGATLRQRSDRFMSTRGANSNTENGEANPNEHKQGGKKA